MCGICGVIHFDGAPVPAEMVRDMTASLVHRGPDGEGVFVDMAGRPGTGPAVGLGHRRLAVIDLSINATQPMLNERGTLAIVFNGEIYNFRDLRARLLAQGYHFRSQSDTEVVLYLYQELGERCVDELDGMFALCIWDKPGRRLFLARDRAGKKPLYYVRNGSWLAFGSEVKALLRHPGVATDFNVEALPHYFTMGYPPHGETFYRGITPLPPAHTLTVEADGKLKLRGYWDLRFTQNGNDTLPLAEVASQVRTLVTEAVRKRLVADVPLGAFLSGGVDSSIVVGVMSRLLDRPVKTFSLGFSADADFNETPYARLVARHFSTDHTEFIVEPKAIDLIERLVWHHDGPFGDPSAIPSYIVAQLTRQHVTVALNGDGGDELFAGYLRFVGCLAAERLPLTMIRLGHKVMSRFPEPTGYHHWLMRAKRFFAVASEPLLERPRKWIAIFPEGLSQLLRPEILRAIDVRNIGYPADIVARTTSYSSLSKLLYVNYMTYLPEDLLVKMDRATMAHGLEARSPFLDWKLTEYVATLPDHFKLKGRTTKYILKEAFKDLLPASILQREKRGFGVPLGAWFRGELREYVQDTLLSPQALAREYLNVEYVRSLVGEHTEGIRDHGHRLWALMMFEAWLQAVRRHG